MDKGFSYKKLPESNVLFICTFDPFGKGLSKYTFKEYCDEMSPLALNDGTTKVFYNCSFKGKDISEGLRRLYDYIESGEAEDKLTEKIDEAVQRGRKNAIWRSQYMKERVMLLDAREEGGDIRDNERILDMLRRGKTVEEIVDFCGYPYEQVKNVEDSLTVTTK